MTKNQCSVCGWQKDQHYVFVATKLVLRETVPLRNQDFLEYHKSLQGQCQTCFLEVK